MRYLDEDRITDRYGIGFKMLEPLKVIIEDYLMKMKNMDLQDLKFNEKLAVLEMIGELYPIMADKAYWEEAGYSLFTQINGKVFAEEGKGIALADGLSNLGVAANLVWGSTGHYGKLINSINKKICEEVCLICQEHMDNPHRTYTDHFDTISGLSGVCSYLFLYKEREENKKSILRIMEYLVSLTKVRDIAGKQYPGWSVPPENEIWDVLQKEYPEGSINYGMAHGIAGPLMMLAKGYACGMTVKGQKEAILSITEEYRKVSLKTSSTLYTGIFPLEKYHEKKTELVEMRQSWCYGSLSVWHVLHYVFTVMGCREDKIRVDQELKAIACLDMENYNLHSPILCHGYAGLMTAFRLLYEKEGCVVFYRSMLDAIALVQKSYDGQRRFGFADSLFRGNGIGKEKYLEDKNDFLNGAAGIIMALSAFLKENSRFEMLLMLK